MDIYIVVDAARYEILKAMDRDIELYTTNLHEGFIEVVSKRRLKEYLDKEPHGIGIVLSGWANKAHYRFNDRIYVKAQLFSVFPIVCTPTTKKYTISWQASTQLAFSPSFSPSPRRIGSTTQTNRAITCLLSMKSSRARATTIANCRSCAGCIAPRPRKSIDS